MNKTVSLEDFSPKTVKKVTKKEVTDYLQDHHNCYVLITCSSPSKKGEMKVEMSYEGDQDLAAYLLQSAQFQIEKKTNCCEV